jgi:transcriptional regulator with XRE-family HTH domain
MASGRDDAMTLGQKIRHFRERAGLSQLKLEMEIGASPGHLSRIENGRIEPVKETIVDIAYVLKLNTFEIASLFGIDLSDINQLFEETTRILSTHNLEEILDRTVNELIFKMGYLASMIMLVEGDRISFNALTMSNIAKRTIGCMNRPLSSLSLSLTRDISNLTVKAIRENKICFTRNTRDYTVPAVSRETADKIQELTGHRSNIIFPLYTDGPPFGAIVFVKKYESDFRDERDTLEIISKQIAVAIQNARKFESVINSRSLED